MVNTVISPFVQEDHLEQIKLARSKASNLLVPDDYDGSTYHAKLSRAIAEVRRVWSHFSLLYSRLLLV